jgi:hypothetical protein
MDNKTGIMGFTKTRDPFVSVLSCGDFLFVYGSYKVGPVFDPDHLSSPSQPNAYEGQYIAAGYTGHGMARAFAWLVNLSTGLSLFCSSHGLWIYISAEAIAGMLKAQITGEKWIMPEWLPERYLTWVMRQH